MKFTKYKYFMLNYGSYEQWRPFLHYLLPISQLNAQDNRAAVQWKLFRTPHFCRCCERYTFTIVIQSSSSMNNTFVPRTLGLFDPNYDMNNTQPNNKFRPQKHKWNIDHKNILKLYSIINISSTYLQLKYKLHDLLYSWFLTAVQKLQV